jgi:ribosome-associated heat shock protein Hsp15
LARRHDTLRTHLAAIDRMSTASKPERAGPRLDKWLWAARLYKTRALAVAEIDKGRVTVNGGSAKPGREMRLGDSIELRQGPVVRTLTVLALSDVRGPAPVAQTLYAETPESIAAREAALEKRRLGIAPSRSIEAGRPTKRDRRKLVEWSRWSASVDDDAA